jgi:F0F1-type ATP synthase assembly protein I
MGITVSIFVYAGYRLDLYLKKTPVFLSLGALLGMVIGFYHLMKELQRVNSVKPDSEPEKKRNKWM